jgi:hypothetical protein
LLSSEECFDQRWDEAIVDYPAQTIFRWPLFGKTQLRLSPIT